MSDVDRYQHVVKFVHETPWAILPEVLGTIVEVVRLRASGARLSDEEIQARLAAAPARASRAPSPPTIAVLPLHGVLANKMNLLTAVSGGSSLEGFRAALRSAVEDPVVTAIVLDVDSPGGSVLGVEEAANAVYEARSRKPITAAVNAVAASAAYWIASQAGELVLTPSGEVGSIGVLALHEDFSGLNDKVGRRPTYISAGRFKGEGNPDAPLGAEARAAVQARVDAYYDTFVRGVARGRGVDAARVRNGYGEGRMVGAQRALELGMVDRLEPLEQTLSRVGRRAAQGRALADASPAPALGAREAPRPVTRQEADAALADYVTAAIHTGRFPDTVEGHRAAMRDARRRFPHLVEAYAAPRPGPGLA